MAPHSCSCGSSGNGLPVLQHQRLVLGNQLAQVVLGQVGIDADATRLPLGVQERLERGVPKTTSPYICTKRRYESYTKRALPERLMRPAAVVSFSPRLRMVSIMPDIETYA